MFYISTLENKYAFIKTWKAKFKFKFLEFPTTMHQSIEIQGEQPGPGSLSPAFSSTRDHNRFPSNVPGIQSIFKKDTSSAEHNLLASYTSKAGANGDRRNYLCVHTICVVPGDDFPTGRA